MKASQIVLTLFILMASFNVLCKTEAEKASEKSLKAVTLFVDVNKLTRKNFAARKMTRLHNEFADKGYELVSVSPYTENGDLEGFFVSYKLASN